MELPSIVPGLVIYVIARLLVNVIKQEMNTWFLIKTILQRKRNDKVYNKLTKKFTKKRLF